MHNSSHKQINYNLNKLVRYIFLFIDNFIKSFHNDIFFFEALLRVFDIVMETLIILREINIIHLHLEVFMFVYDKLKKDH